MQKIQMSTTVNLFGEAKEVKYPNVGEKIKIENLKILLSNGQYGDFARSSHKTALQLLDLIDAYSYFSILIPEMKLSIDVFNSLLPEQEKEYRRAYSEEYFPYFIGVENSLNGEDKSKED